MAAYQKFNCFVEDFAEKKHDLGSDTLKIVLSNTAPSAANTLLANITQITAANGYTAGGAAVTITDSSQTAGTYKLVGNDVVFTAAGGSIGPFRYAVLYNDTAADDPLIGFWDRGSSTSILDGETLTIDLDQTNGILTIV